MLGPEGPWWMFGRAGLRYKHPAAFVSGMVGLESGLMGMFDGGKTAVSAGSCELGL